MSKKRNRGNKMPFAEMVSLVAAILNLVTAILLLTEKLTR